jgi:hypothetical protein
MQQSRTHPFLLATAVMAVLLVAAGVPLGSLVPLALLLVCPRLMTSVANGAAAIRRQDGGTTGGAGDASCSDHGPSARRG